MVSTTPFTIQNFIPPELYSVVGNQIERVNLQKKAAAVTEEIQSLIESHKNTLFFYSAALYSSLGFFHIFCAGIPIGIALSIGARHFSGDETPWYPLNNPTPESIAVISTLGTMSLTGRIVTTFDINFFNYTDGVLPSLTAGTMTGMAITSSILCGIDAIRKRIF